LLQATRKKLGEYLRLLEDFKEGIRVRSDPEYLLEPDVLSDAKRFNEYIGLPLHPRTGLPTQLYDYQYDILNATERSIIIVKSRKIGISEVAIRRFAQRCFTSYAGYQVLFVSQSEEFAIRLMRRFQALLMDSPLGEEIEESNQTYTRFRNGCEAFSRPTSAKALRSFERCKAILLDEAAHFGRTDDYELYAAVRPSIINTQGDIMIVSTPNGRRGFFSSIYFGDDSFRKFELPYTVAPDLIDPSELERDRKSLGNLFAQEYMCSFESPGLAAIEGSLISECEVLETVQKW
jgi:hypothetical protein